MLVVAGGFFVVYRHHSHGNSNTNKANTNTPTPSGQFTKLDITLKNGHLVKTGCDLSGEIWRRNGIQYLYECIW